MTGPEGNKINCFPRDQSLSDLLYSWEFIKPRYNGGTSLVNIRGQQCTVRL